MAFLPKAWSNATLGQAWPSASYIVPGFGVCGNWSAGRLCPQRSWWGWASARKVVS